MDEEIGIEMTSVTSSRRKGLDINEVEAPDPASRHRHSATDPQVLAGQIFDERFESTKRGLKSR